MGYDVEGKTVIVTGAAGGFGKEYARRLLQLGARWEDQEKEQIII